MPKTERVDVSPGRVRAARAEYGWTQQDLAASAGVTRNTIATMERGGSVRWSTRLAVVRALGIAEDAEGPSLHGASDAQLLGEVATRMARGDRR